MDKLIIKLNFNNMVHHLIIYSVHFQFLPIKDISLSKNFYKFFKTEVCEFRSMQHASFLYLKHRNRCRYYTRTKNFRLSMIASEGFTLNHLPRLRLSRARKWSGPQRRREEGRSRPERTRGSPRLG